MRSFLLHAYLFKACKFHLLLSRNEHITALKKLVMLNTAYFFPFSFFDTCAVLNGIINLGYFEDFYYSLFFPKEFYTKKRIRIPLSYCTILYHFVESIIQDSINSTYSQSTLFFFFNYKKIEFRFPFRKNTNYSKRNGIGQSSTIVDEYSIITEETRIVKVLLAEGRMYSLMATLGGLEINASRIVLREQAAGKTLDPPSVL